MVAFVSLKKSGNLGYALIRFWFRFAFMRTMFSWWLTNMSNFLPINKISESETLLCFYHPQPSYALHILLVPKNSILSLSHLGPQDDEFLSDLINTVRSLIQKFELEERGYRLIVNGGEYQEFPQLHFHLISDG